MLSTLGYAYEGSTFNPPPNEVYLLLSGQLVALPAQLPQTYVNTSLLTASNCIDVPE